MTSLNHSNNLCLVTLYFPSSTPPPSSTASPSSTSSNGWTKKISEKIEELKTKLESLKNLKETKNGYLSEKDSKSIDSLPTQLTSLETVHKLAEFADQLDTTKNASNNILNNLCTGLETFLGFDSNTKGYDGTGIVYSDLDRLCDGVMGFLSGVLGAVKDDEAVKTYDNGAKNISKIIQTLENNSGNGPQKFTDALTAVSNWLNDYFTQVEKYTGNVTGQLGVLKNNIAGKYTNSVSGKEASPLDEQLTNWKTTLQSIDKDVQRVESNVNLLDSALKRDVLHEIKPVKVAVKLLNDSAKEHVFGEQMRAVDTVLKEQKKHLDDAVKRESGYVKDTLQTVFANIRASVTSLEETKDMQFQSIHALLQKTQKMVDSELSEVVGTKRNGIFKRFEGIKRALERLDPKCGDGVNSHLKRNALEIRGDLYAINDDIHGCVKALGEWINDASKVLNDSINTAFFIVDKQPGEHNRDAIAKNAQQLLQRGEEIYWHYNWAKEHVETLVADVQAKIGKLYKVLEAGETGENTDGHRKIQSVIDLIKRKVIDIKGSEFDAKGLVDIVAKMKAYAENFKTKEGFDRIVGEWIDKILKNNGVVKRWLDDYFKYNTSTEKNLHSTITSAESLHDHILKVIKTTLDEKIGKASQEVTTRLQHVDAKTYANKRIEMYVNAVKAGVNNFVSALDGKLNKAKDAGGFNIDEIVDGIGRHVKNELSSEYRSYTLHGVVEGTLAALSSTARQAVQQMDQLLETCRFKNVDGVLQHTGNLLQNFYKALTPENGEPPAQCVDDAIANIKTQMVAAFKRNVENKYVNSQKQEEGTLRILSKEIKKNLEELSDEFAKTGSAVGEQLRKLKNDNITIFLNQIREAIESVRYNNVNAVTNAIQVTLAKIHELEAVPGNVDKMKGEVDELMKQLYNELCDQLNVIGVAVAKADDALKDAIRELFIIISNSYDNAQHVLNALKKSLLREVENAFAIVTDAVQKLFARHKRADLFSLKSLLTRQLKIISCTINKDLNTGLKGFLKTLSGDSVDIYLAGYEERPKHPPAKTQKTNLLDPVKTAVDVVAHGDKVAHLSSKFKEYSQHIFGYLDKDLKQNFASQPRVIGDYPSRITTIRSNLTHLLTHISTQKHFDHLVPGKLETLKTSVTTFKSSHFGNASYPVLDAFPQSLVRFVGELERMYVSVYEGEEWRNEHQNNYAKVVFSCIPMLLENFTELKGKCTDGGSWGGKRINVSIENVKYKTVNALGRFMQRLGYDVSKETGSHEGELRNKAECTGNTIGGLLAGTVISPTGEYHLIGVIDNIFNHLNEYNDVCHFIVHPKPKIPCSIFEMLCWFSGLPHNPVYTTMRDVTVSDLFVEQKEDGADDAITVTAISDAPIIAYPNDITYSKVSSILTHITSKAYDVLANVLGNGDAYTMYASDFSNNSLELKYPTSGDECLQMLLEMLRRVFPVFRFLYSQCNLTAKHHGWAGCQYGKDTPTTKWQCSKQPEKEPTCEPKCKPNCQPTSPLMCYLNDCLPGHLPHHLTSVGCKSECRTCPKLTPGMPCLTPLGFRGFSGSTKTGGDLCEIIDAFLNFDDISCIFSLIPRPPSTLPEHFGFTLSLVDGWNTNGSHSLLRWLMGSISKQSIQLYSRPSHLTGALRNAYSGTQTSHGDNHIDHTKAAMSSLSNPKSCILPNKEVFCAPYLASLCHDSQYYLAEKHADNYLSWAIYLPWRLHGYLKSFLNAFQSISCQDWGCRKCQQGDKCRPGQHGVGYNCKCHALVRCGGVLSTFYNYGFTFGNSTKLLDVNERRYCRDFYSQLRNVVESSYFKDLFTECDNFIWTIRAPFIWLNVALWSLSLFYLICVMVGRLDLLHIRSHLRTSSSHKITAQSLLAAAQVGRLAKISYLQP